MKRFLLFVTIMLAATLAAAGWQVRQFLTGDVVLGEGDVELEVPAGATPARVFAELESAGVIRSARVLGWLARVEQTAGCLQAGDHVLPGAATPRELLAALCRAAERREWRLTMVEGTNLFELRDQLAERDPELAAEVLRLATEEAATFAPAAAAGSLEGWLFPDTYHFFEDVTARALLDRLVARAAEVRATMPLADASELARRYTWPELLTIASIVEEEAQVADERPLVARVIFNRLERGMKLQCDPTCVYGPAHYLESASPALCRDPASTHSTYVLPALPPTPISNPGRAAIEATLHPADDPNVLFFVATADGTGRHAFAATYEEHQANVRRYIERTR